MINGGYLDCSGLMYRTLMASMMASTELPETILRVLGLTATFPLMLAL
jgi:hypothetical protein